METLEQLRQEKKELNAKIKEARREKRQQEGTIFSNAIKAVRCFIYSRLKPHTRNIELEEGKTQTEAKLDATLDKIEGLLDRAIEEEKCLQPVSH